MQRIDPIKLATLMHEKGISNQWLANKMEVSTRTIYRWTKDGRIQERHLPELAAILGIEPREILPVHTTDQSMRSPKLNEVHKLIESLPGYLQEVAGLYYVEGKLISEIAGDLGITRRSVSEKLEVIKRHLNSLARHEDTALGLRCQLSEFADPSAIADEIETLMKAINALHISYGGNGFVIDDFQSFCRQPELVGAE